MSVPDEVVLGWTYALVLVSLAVTLPSSVRQIRKHWRLAGLGPGSSADAGAVYLGSSTLLILFASGLLAVLGLRYASVPVLLTTVLLAGVVAWAGRAMWRRRLAR